MPVHIGDLCDAAIGLNTTAGCGHLEHCLARMPRVDELAMLDATDMAYSDLVQEARREREQARHRDGGGTPLRSAAARAHALKRPTSGDMMGQLAANLISTDSIP
jgi:hypothetical protein